MTDRPTSCGDCGAGPTTADHRCAPTVSTPAQLPALVDELEARAARQVPHADRDTSERPGPTIVGMVDGFGRPATVFTPPEDLRRDPARWPTPEEFVAEWEQYTPEQRLQLAERIIADGQQVAEVAAVGWATSRSLERAEAALARVKALPGAWESLADEHEQRGRDAYAVGDIATSIANAAMARPYGTVAAEVRAALSGEADATGGE